jgi:hypothetical protein
MRPAALAAVLVSLAAPAVAQPTLPTRDVTIVYRVAGGAHEAIPGGIGDTVRVSWNAERQRIRVEPQGRPQTLLVDLAAGSVRVIDSGLHSAMKLPVRPKDLDPVRLQDAHLTRHGQATIAGLACTEYATESRRGHGTVCLTDDGVALRAEGQIDGRDGSFTAVSVAYAPLPPTLFDVPQGYMSLNLPPGLSRLQ